MQICLIKWQNLGCDTQINLQTTKKEYYLRVVKKNLYLFLMEMIAKLPIALVDKWETVFFLFFFYEQYLKK